MRYFVLLLILCMSCAKIQHTQIVVLDKDIGRGDATNIETNLGTFECDKDIFIRLVLNHIYLVQYRDGYDRTIFDATEITQ
jgi:hypothetical protein